MPPTACAARHPPPSRSPPCARCTPSVPTATITCVTPNACRLAPPPPSAAKTTQPQYNISPPAYHCRFITHGSWMNALPPWHFVRLGRRLVRLTANDWRYSSPPCRNRWTRRTSTPVSSHTRTFGSYLLWRFMVVRPLQRTPLHYLHYTKTSATMTHLRTVVTFGAEPSSVQSCSDGAQTLHMALQTLL